MPLEFAVAVYRFGHTMVRSDYEFNLNFNDNGPAQATLDLLFTFTALQGQLGFGGGSDTLPENWIIEWERFTGPNPSNKARLLDTKLVNPLVQLAADARKEWRTLWALLDLEADLLDRTIDSRWEGKPGIGLPNACEVSKVD